MYVNTLVILFAVYNVRWIFLFALNLSFIMGVADANTNNDDDDV